MKKSKQERVMKQYLKMADVFVHDSVEELEQHIYAGYMSKHCSEYAAHAINSHDELVQMNKELLAALKMVVGDITDLANNSSGVCGLHLKGEVAGWRSLFVGGSLEAWLMSVDDAERLIAKLNGGDA